MLYVYEIYRVHFQTVYAILTSTTIKICSSETAWYKGKHTINITNVKDFLFPINK